MKGLSLKTLISTISIISFVGLNEYAYCSLKPRVIEGSIDISSWDFNESGSMELSGNWLFIWDEIITPDSFSTLTKNKGLSVKFPGLWTNYSFGSKSYPSFGVATYMLTINGLEKDREYAINLPDMYSSYNLWVGNKLIAKNGKIAKNEEDYLPQWLPQTVSFKATNSSEVVLLTIANFDHSKGGIKNEIRLGKINSFTSKRWKEVSANLISIFGIAILSIVAIFTYFKSGNKLFIYYAIFCFLWSIRGLFSGMYLIYNWLPDLNWVFGVKIEYLTIYTSVLIGFHTFHKLFPDHSKSSLNYLSIVINGIFISITILSPPVVFTQLLNIYFSYMAITLLYILIEVIRAYIHDEKGAGYISIAIALVILLFLYDMMSYYKYLPHNPLLISLGYVIFYALLGFSIHYNMNNKKEPIAYYFSQ